MSGKTLKIQSSYEIQRIRARYSQEGLQLLFLRSGTAEIHPFRIPVQADGCVLHDAEHAIGGDILGNAESFAVLSSYKQLHHTSDENGYRDREQHHSFTFGRFEEYSIRTEFGFHLAEYVLGLPLLRTDAHNVFAGSSVTTSPHVTSERGSDVAITLMSRSSAISFARMR